MGDPSLILGLGRSSEEGIGNPLQHFWASVAQMVKKPPAMREIWLWSLGWEDPLEEGMATHSSILTWRIPMDRGSWWAIVPSVANSQTWLRDSAHIAYILHLQNVIHQLHLSKTGGKKSSKFVWKIEINGFWDVCRYSVEMIADIQWVVMKVFQKVRSYFGGFEVIVSSLEVTGKVSKALWIC